MLYLVLGMTVLLAIFGWFVKLREGQCTRRRAGAKPYHRLLRKTRGDKAQAERLIEYERRRHPQWGRELLIAQAIENWERSNR